MINNKQKSTLIVYPSPQMFHTGFLNISQIDLLSCRTQSLNRLKTHQRTTARITNRPSRVMMKAAASSTGKYFTAPACAKHTRSRLSWSLSECQGSWYKQKPGVNFTAISFSTKHNSKYLMLLVFQSRRQSSNVKAEAQNPLSWYTCCADCNLLHWGQSNLSKTYFIVLIRVMHASVVEIGTGYSINNWTDRVCAVFVHAMLHNIFMLKLCVWFWQKCL